MKQITEAIAYEGLRRLLSSGEPSILALDPGESTGWCFISRDNNITAGTAPKDHLAVAERIDVLNPDIVVFETFNMYPGKAQSLIWNSFYPCEVIGVIKYKCASLGKYIIGQAPSIKKYAGPLPNKFVQYSKVAKLTEHSKDACQHLCYYLRQVRAIDRALN